MIKATMHTRCGSTREIATTYPPNKVILLPMFPAQSTRRWDGIDNDHPSYETRTFELRHFLNYGPLRSTADYYEI